MRSPAAALLGRESGMTAPLHGTGNGVAIRNGKEQERGTRENEQLLARCCSILPRRTLLVVGTIGHLANYVWFYQLVPPKRFFFCFPFTCYEMTKTRKYNTSGNTETANTRSAVF